MYVEVYIYFCLFLALYTSFEFFSAKLFSIELKYHQALHQALKRPVSLVSRSMYVNIGLPPVCLPWKGSHVNKSPANSFLFRQQCPAKRNRCSCIFPLNGGIFSYNSLVNDPSSLLASQFYVKVHVVELYKRIDSTHSGYKRVEKFGLLTIIFIHNIKLENMFLWLPLIYNLSTICL